MQIYDLARDREYVERVQKATIDGGDFALSQEHGLFGSSRWWQALRSGELASRELTGVIARVYLNASNWPEFEVEADGERSSWALEGAPGRYRPGKRARIQYVMLRYARPPEDGEAETRVVTGIWVEA